MREGLVNVLVFARERDWIDDCEVDLVAKQVVEIDRREGIFPQEERLLNPSFECAVFFRFQIGVGNDSRPAGELLFKARLLDAGGVGKSQPRPGKELASAKSQVT